MLCLVIYEAKDLMRLLACCAIVCMCCPIEFALTVLSLGRVIKANLSEVLRNFAS